MKDLAPVVVLGAGGHARVLLDELKGMGREVMGITDPSIEPGATMLGVNVLGDDTYIDELPPQSFELVNGIGALPKSSLRWDIARKMKDKGYQFSTVVSLLSAVAGSVKLSEGVQVMAGAVIQTSVTIGKNSVANTGCTIDHDCVIGENVWISPGVTICGNVVIGDCAYVGAGSVLIQDITIGAHAIINAGSVVKKSLPAGDQHFHVV